MDLEGGFTLFPLQSTGPTPKRSFRRPPYMKKPYSGMSMVPRHPRVRMRVGMGMGWQGSAYMSEERSEKGSACAGLAYAYAYVRAHGPRHPRMCGHVQAYALARLSAPRKLL